MKLILSVMVAFGLVGCTSAEQLTKILEKDPTPIINAMKKNPVAFAKVTEELKMLAQKQSQEDFLKNLEAKIKEQFETPLVPKVEDERLLFGKSDAPITIVEYSDFLCYYCGKAATTVKALKEEYGDKLRFVYKHLPFKGEAAKTASLYFEALTKDDKAKAYKFHDLVFEAQREVATSGTSALDGLVKKAGGNLAKVKALASSDEIGKRIEADMEEGRKFEIEGTPGFMVNGVMLGGAFPIELFKKIIDFQLGGKKGDFKLMDEEEKKVN